MPINSRAKGKRGEREFAELLREMGFEDASRGATQSAGAITADVVGLPHHWCEVKNVDSIAALRYLDQAKRDVVKVKSDEIPVAFIKENRGRFAALLDARVYLALLRAAFQVLDWHRLKLRDFIEKPSAPVKVKAPKRVAKGALPDVKAKKHP